MITTIGLKFFELLLIPLILLLLGIVIQKGISERQEDLIVTQMVDNYFEGVANQLTNSSEMNSSVIIARTIAIFYRLKQLQRKKEIINVIRFISEVTPEILEGDVFEQDPQSDQYFIDFSGIELSNSLLEIIKIEGLRSWNANFNNSSFDNFSCTGCGFTGSSFENAEFINVAFDNCDLTGTNFFNSNIHNVDVDGSKFDGAIWSDGRICGENSIGKCKYSNQMLQLTRGLSAF